MGQYRYIDALYRCGVLDSQASKTDQQSQDWDLTSTKEADSICLQCTQPINIYRRMCLDC